MASLGRPALTQLLREARNPLTKPYLAMVRRLIDKEPVRLTTLPRSLFAAPTRSDIFNRVSLWYQASLRAGTASSKSRGQVAGSRRKIRRQKGTGKARVGDNRAHHRVGGKPTIRRPLPVPASCSPFTLGGKAFGPKPRIFAYHMPKKIVQLGLRSALATKYRQGQFMLVDEASLDIQNKTETQFIQALEQLYALPKKAGLNRLDPVEVTPSILLIDTEPAPPRLDSITQPMTQFKILNVTDQVNAYHVLHSNLVLMTMRAVQYYYNEHFPPQRVTTNATAHLPLMLDSLPTSTDAEAAKTA